MAYVAISKDLITRVVDTIHGMRRKEIAAAYPDIEKSFQVDASHIYNIGSWGADTVHLMNSIPKDWLNPQQRAYIAVAGTHSFEVNGEVVQVHIEPKVEFTGLTYAYARPSKDYWNRVTSELHIDDVRKLPDGYIGKAELIQRFEDTCGASEITHKWDKIAKEMKDFLGKCKSLNEAVKLFPNIKLYLHSDDILRLERKIERTSREALVVEIDTDGITAAAVAARLMGAA